MTLARFSPPAPPLSGHVPRRRRFAPVRQLLKFLRIFPVISYIFINILSYKNLYPIPLRILYLHIMFVFETFTFNIFAFDIFTFDIFASNIFAFNIFAFDIFPFDIFTIQIHIYNIPKNPQMCPAHRDLPTPSHPHSRLNLPHPIPSHTYNGLKTISLPTTPSGRSPPSAQPSVSNTAAYRHKSTKLPPSTTKHSKKEPEGCAEGPRLCGPFAVFLFSQKNTASVRQSERNTVFFKSIFLHFVT